MQTISTSALSYSKQAVYYHLRKVRLRTLTIWCWLLAPITYLKTHPHYSSSAICDRPPVRPQSSMFGSLVSPSAAVSAVQISIIGATPRWLRVGWLNVRFRFKSSWGEFYLTDLSDKVGALRLSRSPLTPSWLTQTLQSVSTTHKSTAKHGVCFKTPLILYRSSGKTVG